MVNYPAQLDNGTSLPVSSDNSTAINAAVVNRLRSAIIAVETELGIKPSGVYGNVRSRLDTIEGLLGGVGGSISLFGDVTGGIATTVVSKINGTTIATAGGSLIDGYILTVTGAATANWAPAPNISGVQNGSNYGSYLISPSFQPFSTASGTFINAACFEFDPTLITAANGTRAITLRVIVETTSPQITIQLYNQTTHSVVTGSTLTSSSTTAATLTTGDLTANLTNGLATYFVQILMAAGTVSDRATLDYASLKVVWS